ncbi:cbb3-type cytochrome oxidase assembly protein CcoS [Hahella sp. SMD15-11]|uniref:Cbb3-type cytochrome oxidase assembly protein CcoS n=1 Tax=Thermohahella caldifontis TaxID=3142973 RepID=A0AB39UZR2_9GAMM
MEVLYLLIPISIILVTIGVLLFRWAVRSGQYDDLDTAGHSILFDDDMPAKSGTKAEPKRPSGNDD